MNASAFLPATMSILMVLVSVYGLCRLLAAPVLGLATEVETDLLLIAAGIAGAGLLSNWAHTLPRVVWAGVFAVAGCYFAVRAILTRNDAAQRGRAAAHAGGCAVLVYMFLAGVAPSSLHGSTAGQYTMAPMPGMYLDATITYPALGLVCVAALAFHAVSVVARLSPGGTAVDEPRRASTSGSVEACRVLVELVLAYAILSKLV